MLQNMTRAILSDAKRMSYTLIAARYGLTRNQVAGIIWREKNPIETRRVYENKDGKKGGGRCGRGRHGPGPIPEKTISNTR